MKIVSKRKTGMVVLLERGDELIAALKKIAASHQIRGAWFTALGAADDIEVASYSLHTKKYSMKRFRGEFEILNITGNVARKGTETIVHAHGSFGRTNFSTIGGHIMKCLVSASCEIHLQKLPPLNRAFNPEIGLNLFI